MLLGLHCGDSLGATLEFCSPQAKENWQTEIIGGGHFRWKPGDATDDTDLALIILESLEGNSFNQKTCINKMIAWLKTDPKDVGLTTRTGIESLENGVLPEPTISLANGSLMRCSPLALLDIPQEQLNIYIEEACVLTHNNPKCVYLDKVFIQILKFAMTANNKQQVFDFATNLTAKNLEIDSRIAIIPSTSWDQLSTRGYVVDGLICALWSLYHAKDFEEGLVLVVNRGDDSDTNGAISGALLGAFYGQEAIPERYLNKLQYRQQIINLVNSRK